MDISGFRVVTGKEAVDVLLDRAKRLADHGVPPGKSVRTGLPKVDEGIRSWWGCVTLTGEPGIGKTALALRFASETAAAAARVLWLCMGGHSELAVLRLITSRARVRLRKVMVERSLTPQDWWALRRAGAEVSRWPIEFGDAHGATLDELRTLCSTVAVCPACGRTPLELIVLDHFPAPDRPTLRTLQRVADELNTPILTVFSPVADGGEADDKGASQVRPGTLELSLQRAEDVPGSAPGRRLVLAVGRAGGTVEHRVPLELVPEYRSVDAAPSA